MLKAMCGVAASVAAAVIACCTVPEAALAQQSFALGAPYGNWTGFYIGANAGFMASTDSWQFGATRFFAQEPVPMGYAGFMVGPQAGYQYQVGSWVFGAVTDFSLGGASAFNDCFRDRFICSTQISDVATFRGTFGYVPQSEPLAQFYLTAGLALAREFNLKISEVGPVKFANADLLAGIASEQVGWAVGGGVQYQVWPAGKLGPSLPGAVSVGMEFLYIGWPDNDISRGITVGSASTVQLSAFARYMFNTPVSPY
ncbi:MAG TPA: hypothetical protein VK442_04405 [Xanthobacteraceae bacterium]|nr:hypothetical protein [Xanthobacteraceae bacterium]